jgi:hypothetical protein
MSVPSMQWAVAVTATDLGDPWRRIRRPKRDQRGGEEYIDVVQSELAPNNVTDRRCGKNRSDARPVHIQQSTKSGARYTDG